MPFDEFHDQLPDVDPAETAEWMQALSDVVDHRGAPRASYLMRRLLAESRRLQLGVPAMVSTHYVNTIAPEEEPPFPGDEDMERKIRRLIRWNAAVMVLRANKKSPGIGGHLSTYASAASLYEVGFNHFFRGPDHSGGGDQLFIQGHASPGIYSRAYLEGRLTTDALDNFRQEVATPGLSSYPHPRLMPEFWQFPTVSMGLGPLNAVYQARFNRYLQARGFKDTSDQRVWAFTGDGEMDEPESIAGLTLAARERLDNLIFVVNCNLQRLDGPVRGNHKIIQELESLFRGAGWHVIKVVWGREWDSLLAADTDGVLVQRLDETRDGEYQNYSISDGAYIRENFFGPDPRLRRLVENWSDADIKRLRRGGHDYRKLYAAYEVATSLKDQPTVILAKTVKGWTLPDDVKGRNVAHQAKKLSETDLRKFRDELELPISDTELEDLPYHHPGDDSDVVEYLKWRRSELGGFVPQRRTQHVPISLPKEDAYSEFLAGREGMEAATTQALVRLMRNLLRDPELGERIVPIIPDEARTFGMESLFKTHKIYNPLGQLYEAVDKHSLLPYVESETGQVIEEGITEAGSMAMFTAAGSAYSTHGQPLIPFFVLYSMFGFQRVGDLIWQAGDQRVRGFLCGATFGRTTLSGEGLQHQDGHSPLVASTVPSVISYDPAFAYEVAVIVREGLRRMWENNEDLLYYITLYNEQYAMPPMPSDAADGIIRGGYLYLQIGSKPKLNLCGSGPMVNSATAVAEQLQEEFGISSRVFSMTSYSELRRQAMAVSEASILDPSQDAPYVTELLSGADATVAVSDCIRAVPDQVAQWVKGEWISLGTDGWGRSDSREALRRHFKVDADHTLVASLAALERTGAIKKGTAAKKAADLGVAF